MVKLLPNDPTTAYETLKAAGFTVSRREVVVAIVPDRPGSLHRLLQALSSEHINVEDCYGFVLQKGKEAAIVLEATGNADAGEVLARHGARLLPDGEVLL